MLTHAKKASDAKDDVFQLARLVQDDIVYIAYLFVCFIVDVNADKFRSSPFALPVHGGYGVGRRCFVRVGLDVWADAAPAINAVRHRDRCIEHQLLAPDRTPAIWR